MPDAAPETAVFPSVKVDRAVFLKTNLGFVKRWVVLSAADRTDSEDIWRWFSTTSDNSSVPSIFLALHQIIRTKLYPKRTPHFLLRAYAALHAKWNSIHGRYLEKGIPC